MFLKLINSIWLVAAFKWFTKLNESIDTTIVSAKGWQILNDPKRLKNVNKAIDLYKKTGVWQYDLLTLPDDFEDPEKDLYV